MKVPVRPTPALQKKVQMARESQQASVLLEVNRKCLKPPRWGENSPRRVSSAQLCLANADLVSVAWVSYF